MAAFVRRDPLESGFAPGLVRSRLELLPIEGRFSGGAKASVGANAPAAR